MKEDNRLKLNKQETKFLVTGSHRNCAKDNVDTINVFEMITERSPVAINLGGGD